MNPQLHNRLYAVELHCDRTWNIMRNYECLANVDTIEQARYYAKSLGYEFMTEIDLLNYAWDCDLRDMPSEYVMCDD